VPDRGLAALVVDWGGVLTSDLGAAMDDWASRDQVDPASFRAVMREWLGPGADAQVALNPVHALERGELEVPHFEAALAARLRTVHGDPVAPAGLLTRMFAAFAAAPDMVGLVRRAHASGLATALLSNSWGLPYPRDGWADMFDVVVISGEVGMRKPEARIYRHTADLLAVAPSACVFVDDLAPNVAAAAAVGMVGVHHRDYATTATELEALFDRPLA